MPTIDLTRNPDIRVRLDSFAVPEAARPDFLAATARNLAFLHTLPGFLGHAVFEKTGGPTSFNIATIAIWQSQRALDSAREKVRAYYQQIGFDPRAFMARHGIRGEIGDYGALPEQA
jgi:hypothetical protein